MADVLGKKISELAETTDLAGLYTIGSDRNNQSKKVPLQFVKEAADYANAQGDYAKGVGDTVQGNTGVDEYPVFSASTQYAAGSVVRYNDKLYRFTSLHPAGSWVGTDAVETSIKAETELKLTELESKTKLVNTLNEESFEDEEISICTDNGEEIVKIDKEGVNVKDIKIKGEKVVSVSDDEKESSDEISICTDNGEEIVKIDKEKTILKNPHIKKNDELINIYDAIFEKGNVIDLYKPLLNKAMQMPYDSTDGNHDISSKNPSFIFFSDIHASSRNLTRIIELTNSWSEKTNIKAVINGGDAVSSRNEEQSWIDTYTNQIQSCNCDALFALGNHDAWVESNWNWDTEQNLFEKFKGFVKGLEIDKFYYFKDYDNVRIIVLNSGYYWSDIQKNWLTSTLKDAHNNSKAVIIVQHYPFRCVVSGESLITPNNMAESIKCSFTQVGLPLVTDVAINTLNDDVLECVDAFIEYGGTFICHFAGHTHYDGFYKHKEHPNQVMFITGSANYAKFYHEIKSDDENNCLFDQFNIFSVSTRFGLLKIVRIGANEGFEMESKNVLVFDYINKVVINNY